MSKHYHVYVLDERNQGLSQKADLGSRIYRYSMDLREFNEHIGVKSAYYCGWSMGVSILYGYIDLFGTRGIEKLILIDEPPSILSRPGMTKEERVQSGAIADSVQEVATVMAVPSGVSLMDRYNAMDSLPYANSEAFAREMAPVDRVAVSRIMYDHASIDWRDVIRTKIDVPTAIFTGEYSANVPSQRWMKSVIPNSTLYIYSKAEQGDHFLAFKNPFKFTKNLESFLKNEVEANSGAHSDIHIDIRELMQTEFSWNGAAYGAYPTGEAEPVVAKITIPAHAELPWHAHSVPSFAYMLSGEITVEDKHGNGKHFAQGQVMPEQSTPRIVPSPATNRPRSSSSMQQSKGRGFLFRPTKFPFRRCGTPEPSATSDSMSLQCVAFAAGRYPKFGTKWSAPQLPPIT